MWETWRNSPKKTHNLYEPKQYIYKNIGYVFPGILEKSIEKTTNFEERSVQELMDSHTYIPCDRKRVQPGTLVHVPGEVGHVMKTILC